MMMSRVRLGAKIVVRLAMAASFFFLSFAVATTWQDPDAALIRSMNSMPDHDYLPEIADLKEQGRVTEAMILGKAVLVEQNMPNENEIRAAVEEMEREYNRWSRRAKDFMGAFFTGNGDSPESMIGKTISDFLVIGDLRDLGKEGWKTVRGEESDKVIMALSAAGIAATAATFLPEPGSTAAGVATQPVLTVFKGLRRVGAISRPFGRHLASIMGKVRKTRRWAPARKTMGHMAAVMRQAPTGGLPVMMRHVDTVDDLAALAKGTARQPWKTAAALQVGGKQALALMTGGARNADRLLGLCLRKGAKGFSRIRLVTRPTLFLFRGRVGEWRNVLRTMAMDNPLVKTVLQGLTILLGLSGAAALFGAGRGLAKLRGMRTAPAPI